MSEPYSDKRWWIAPRGIDSDCNSCIFDYGFNKCEKYPDGIPKEIVRNHSLAQRHIRKNIASIVRPIKQSTLLGAYLIALK